MSDAFLLLENGTVFKGHPFGYSGEAVGELVFSTAMAGYLETLADPVYFGQIVLQTFPLIGNYGVIPDDFGSGPVHLKAYIVREWCQEPSNFRSEGNLDSFLRENKIPGLYGIDTRALTRIIRENGVMNAMISKTPKLSEAQWAALREYKVAGAVAAVNAGSAPGSGFRIPNSEFRVAVWNFGAAHTLASSLSAHGCTPAFAAYDMTADEILAARPDGVVLSGGPGDPAENTRVIGEIKKLIGSGIPVFGVGLGHQMLALARGAKCEKLLFGHHGSNQAVTECATGRMFITDQNHGYAVIPDSLPGAAKLSYVNSNDGTCEGIEYADFPAFSVQFDPSGDFFEKFFRSFR